MAKASKTTTEKTTEEEKEIRSSKDIIYSLLKSNKTDHYNFEETVYYKVPSSSLILNMEIGGGMSPGCHRFTGTTSGGKSSAALDFMFNFLKTENRKGIYFKCEGRLSEEMKARSGVKFVSDSDEWQEGTCLVVDSNVYEFVFDTIRQLITENDSKTQFFFIIDSVDMMAKRTDLQKALEDAQTVAGGALITSVFLKKVSVALAKRGHIAVFISQVRETVKINPYTITPPKQGGASGGHALEHAADLVLEFQSRFSDDIIRENPNDKNSKPIGHFAKCRIVKSNNESYLRDVRYPILYGRKNGHSIWREKEVADMAIMWELVVKKGAWITPIETFVTELQENDLQIEEKFHGIEQFYQWIEKNPKVVDFIAKRFS